MTIVNTTISAVTDGTYGLANSLIGQIKAIIDDDPNVTIVSDNNPDNATARVLVYSLANCGHNYKLSAATGPKITSAVLKIDDATELLSVAGASTNYTSGYVYTVRFLYNSTTHALMLPYSGAIADAPRPTFLAFDTGAAAGWYQQFGYTNWGTYYDNFLKVDSDLWYDVSTPAYSGLLDGKFVAIPIRFFDAGNMLTYYHNYYYFSSGLLADGLHQDTAGKYYLTSLLGSSIGITIKDP